MFSTSDTIVAIATPPGRGGIGVVRISGSESERIVRELTSHAAPLEPRRVTKCSLSAGSPDGHRVNDQVLVTFFQAPASYTGEDVIEVSAHGSPVVLGSIVRAVVDAGARLAEPGEFTLRAFLNGKLDLVQAEAVADVIEAVTPLQARAAFDQLEGTLTRAIGGIEHDLFEVRARLEASLDFPEEGYHFVAPAEARATVASLGTRIDALLAQAARGRLVREGAQVAIVGAPNVGKSSLFNALLNANRAIVTDIPGTTRDLLTERADLDGLSVLLVDTAGVRETSDAIEQEGVSRARDAVRVADLTVVVLDRSRRLTAEDCDVLAATAHLRRVIALNKSDLDAAALDAIREAGKQVDVSAKTGAGIGELIDAIVETLSNGESLRDQPLVTNVRHSVLLERARESLARAATALDGGVPEEFPLLDLQEAGDALQEITGRRTTDDMLRHIFERFCIGK